MVAAAGISAMPEGDKPYTTSLVEALHFKQGFHYISVREMEIEIPIPDDGEGNPDYSIIQRAWWDAVDVVEKHRGIASPSYFWNLCISCCFFKLNTHILVI